MGMRKMSMGLKKRTRGEIMQHKVKKNRGMGGRRGRV